jgi:hypothetical protein
MPFNASDYAATSSLKAKILEWKDSYALKTAAISISSFANIDILRDAALYVVAIYLVLTKMAAGELGIGCVKAWKNCQESAREVVRATKSILIIRVVRSISVG